MTAHWSPAMGRRQFSRQKGVRHNFIRWWFDVFGQVCHYCDTKMWLMDSGEPSDREAPTIDHVDPISRGGPALDEDNWQVICRRCNNMKGDLTHYEFLRLLEDPPPDPVRAAKYRVPPEPLATLADVWPMSKEVEG